MTIEVKQIIIKSTVTISRPVEQEQVISAIDLGIHQRDVT